ncbi:MAG: ECF transporter S component [Clostridia bacterium]|nr:ECF transporter S component [Clostridia bacterium]
MKSAISLYSHSRGKRLAFTALFAALCLVGTLVIQIPLPFGYFNAGDVFVLLSAWFLGPLYGAIAAATGSALADIVAGYALYAPATFLIKGLDALVAYTVCAFLKKYIQKERLDFLPRILSGILGEAVMILGYFAYECVLYGLAGGIATLIGNVLQGVFGIVLATALFSVLYSIKSLRNFLHLEN